jgi:hypothetical protein
MKRLALAVGVLALFFAAGGCKKQESENDAIRAGIMQHLSSVGTLNMNAMDMDIRSVSVNGNQAHAEVEFRPKNGAPQGAGMQVGYNLEKRDGAWVVQKTQTLGGMIHPDPNQNPHQNTGVHPGALPNFSDILNPAGAPPQGQGTLPPGHPPINPQQQTSVPPASDQAPKKNPR